MNSRHVQAQIRALSEALLPRIGMERMASLVASAGHKTDPGYMEPSGREVEDMIDAGLAAGKSADQIADAFIAPTKPQRGHAADTKLLRLLQTAMAAADKAQA